MSRLPTSPKDSPLLKLPPIHPGEILADEMAELGLSANALARSLDVPANRISEIVGGRRAVSADTALRLAHYFGTTARFWLNLQLSHDLAVTERDDGDAIAKAVRPRAG